MVMPVYDPSVYYDRIQALVSTALHEKTVLAVGAGAGSFMLQKLARVGIGTLRLADPDRVELANLTRTSFTTDDVGALKVEAMACQIGKANPFVKVQALPCDICSLGEAETAALLEEVSLIIAGTDYFPAQALMNVWSQRAGIPAVFIGIHQGAQGGRIIWTLPGELPCYRCIARERYERFQEQGLQGTDLPGAHGLLVDVQFIDMIALKIILALLERGQPTPLGSFVQALKCRNEVIVRTSPGYEYGNLLWDAVLSDLPTNPKAYADELKTQALFAMDTLWLATQFDSTCPDCGGRPTRERDT